jgi:Tol biopolymer transport system component
VKKDLLLMFGFSLHPNSKTAYKLVLATLVVTGLAVLSFQYVSQAMLDDTIVFMRQEGMDMEIYTVEADGSGEVQLTNNEYEDWAAVWTPDKSQILFHSNRDGYFAIYAMNRDGSDVYRISPEGRHAQFPSVSPDGRYVAFEMYMGTGDEWDIFIMSLNGCGRMSQATFAAGHEGGAAFSPDGTQLAYHSTENGYYDIYVLNLDGTGTNRLTFYPETMDVWPQWSSDGKQIIFHSERDGNSEIYVMNADGSDARNLTNNPSLDRVPRFAADGQNIIFRSERSGESNLYVMGLDGSDVHPLSGDNGFMDLHPDS